MTIPRGIRPDYGAFFILLFSFLLTVSLITTDVRAKEMDLNPRFGEALLHFERGEYETAHDLFYELFKEAPGDAEVNFFLGRSAFESGRYETAVFAFERILIATPENHRVRLEMARAYFKMGSLEEAARHFRIVLESSPPESVKANITRYLSAIEDTQKRNFFNFSISAGISLDDNLYVAPVDDLLTIPALDDLPVSVNRAESGHYFPLGLSATHRYFFEDRPAYWKTFLQTYHTRYSGHDDLEVDYFSASAGGGIRKGRFELGLFPEAYVMLLDTHRYSRAFGTTLQISFFPGGNQKVELTGALRKKTFDDTSDRDGLETGVDLIYSFCAGELIVSPKIALKRESADNDQYGYDRLSTGVTIEWPLPYQLRVYGGYLFENDAYKAEDPLFFTTRRDHSHSVTAGISKEFRITDRFLLIAGVAHTWETVDSSISLYEYERNVTRIYFSLIF
jgi:tetratricopeptide (TPR) repeat protein